MEIQEFVTKTFDRHGFPSENREEVRALLTNRILTITQRLTTIQAIVPKEWRGRIPQIYFEVEKYWNDRKDIEKDYEKTIKERIQTPINDEIPLLSKFSDGEAICIKFALESLRENLLPKIKNEDLLGECYSYILHRKHENGFLNRIPEENRIALSAILREKELSDFVKRDLFQFILPNSIDRKNGRAVLKEMKKQRGIDLADERRRAKKKQHKDQLDSLKKNTTIVIVGQSGVGKSTFINGFYNFLKHISFQDTRTKIGALISSKYMLNNKLYTVQGIADKNENLELGKSSTKNAKIYEFKWLSNGIERSFQLIDTPGLGDTGGIAQDLQNLDIIFKTLAGFRTISGICILVKAGESRLTHQFAYILSEFFGRLPPQAVRNITFCCTNSRNNGYTPGSSMTTLEDFLNKHSIGIALNSSNLYSVDNEWFRYLWAWKKDEEERKRTNPATPQPKIPTTIIDKNSNSWNSSFEASFRLLTGINQLDALSISLLLTLVNARKCFNEICKRINLAENEKCRVEDAIKENNSTITRCDAKIKEINDNSTQEKVRKVNTRQRHTVCQNCAKQKDNLYIFNLCHEDCNCMDTPLKEETVGLAGIHKCSCLKQGELTLIEYSDEKQAEKADIYCQNCGCLWQFHMQISYKTEIYEEIILSKKNKENMQKIKRDKEGAANNLAKSQKKVENLAKELKYLNGKANHLALFIKKCAAISINKSIVEYLGQEINVLKGKNEQTQEIEKLQRTFIQQEKIMERADDGQLMSEQQIEELMEELKNQNKSAELCRSLSSYQLLKSGMQTPKMTTINLMDGWLGSV